MGNKKASKKAKPTTIETNEPTGHPVDRFSALWVKKVREPGFYCDGNGLYLQVHGRASKSWILRTMVNGKRRDIGLGSYRYISLEAARKKAIDMRRAAREGGDPLTAKREAKRQAMIEAEIPTFEFAARAVHAEQHFSNQRHTEQWIGSLMRHAFPKIGTKRVDVIQSDEVLAVLTPIWNTKRETAKRVSQRLRTVFDWAIAKRYRSANPTNAITKVLSKNKVSQKHHAALPWASVPEFVHALRAASNVAEGDRLAFELMILTAVRTSEVLGAKWNEFDLDTKTWIVPAERMKARKQHRVPLTPRMLEILKAAKQLSGESEYVFLGERCGRPLGAHTFHRVLGKMNRSGFTPHGFRSSFRDFAQDETDHKPHTVESALAHENKDRVEAAYLRTDSFQKRRELMTTWEKFATSKPIAKVVAMSAHRKT